MDAIVGDKGKRFDLEQNGSTVVWDEEVDVVVAGSGGGLAGAYTAAREGLSVAVLEATDKFGGTTAYSGGGMWFPCNPVLQRAGVDDTIDDALAYYQAVVGDRTPSELQRAYVEGGARVIEYLERDDQLSFQMFPWPDYYGNATKARGDGKRHIVPTPMAAADLGELRALLRGPVNSDRRGEPLPDMLTGGQALIGRFLLAISKYPNVSLRPHSPLVELVVVDGAVVGAVVESNGDRIAIRARKGVLLAAGGFEQNDVLRKHYGVPGVARDTMGASGNIGLAHQAGVKAGGDVDLMDQAWWSPGLTHPGGQSTFSLGFTSGILVDRSGERFVNESAPYDRLGREVIRHVGEGTVELPYWLVYDDKSGKVPPVMSMMALAGTDEYEAAGLWHTADTLEDLADMIGVPTQNLVGAVARFNEMAAAGVDTDFGRGDESYDRSFSGGSPLVEISHGPFHAAAFGISDLGTKGGLRTDVSARVLDVHGLPIPGLYAAGNTMAAPSGHAYPGGGNPIGTSVLFSHLAARDMAAR